MSTELIELAVAAVGLALIMVGLRRAAKKSRDRAPDSVKERLGVEDAAPPKRERKRPRPQRPSEAAKPEKADKPKPAKAEPAPKPADKDDTEAAAAYKAGLAKTRGGFVAKLGKLFGRKQIDAQTLDELEEVLFTADIGPRAADRIFQSVKTGLSRDDLEDSTKIWSKIKQTSKQIVAVDAKPVDLSAKQPFVLLVLGVNGVGKTTTIGKLAAMWKADGKRVLLAAGDPFRAAATEQLEAGGKRADVPVVKGKANGDPSSVVFDAIKRGVDEGFDVVICDTAG